MLNDRDLIKYKAVRINTPMFYAVLIGISVSGGLKVILIGAGYTILLTWRVYNVLLCLICGSLSFSMTYSGIRLRRKLKRLIDKPGSSYKLMAMMVLGNLGMQSVIISLITFMSNPNVFGK